MCPQFQRYLLLCCYTRRRRKKKFTSFFFFPKKRRKIVEQPGFFVYTLVTPNLLPFTAKQRNDKKNLHIFFEHLSTARLKVMTTRTIISLYVRMCVCVQSFFFSFLFCWRLFAKVKKKFCLKQRCNMLLCVCKCVCMYL